MMSRIEYFGIADLPVSSFTEVTNTQQVHIGHLCDFKVKPRSFIIGPRIQHQHLHAIDHTQTQHAATAAGAGSAADLGGVHDEGEAREGERRPHGERPADDGEDRVPSVAKKGSHRPAWSRLPQKM